MREDEAADLIAGTYEAALDERQWIPLMNRLADLVGGGSTAFIRKNLQTGAGVGMYGRIDAEAFADYYGYFAQRNPLARAIRDMQAGSILIDWQVLPKADLTASEYYNDFLIRRDMHGVLGLMVWRSGDEVAVMNLTRPRRRGDYQADDARILNPFMPHLRRAVALAQHLPRPEGDRLSAELLDRWREAFLVVDETGLVVHANLEAEQILRCGDALRLRQGRLMATDAQSEVRLQAALRTACSVCAPQGTQLSIPHAEDPRGYAVMVAPAGRRSGRLFPDAARAILVIRDLARPRVPEAGELRAIFGFSRGQAAVAARLAAGRDVREIALDLGLSPHTVRRHLSDIMERTETSRQAELVRLLLRVPGPVWH